MSYRYFISQSGSDVLDEAREARRIRKARGAESDYWLVLGILSSEYTYSGDKGKTVRGLKREFFAGGDFSESKLEGILNGLYAEGFVERHLDESGEEDYMVKSQRFGYRGKG